jgi:hypothetical protein
VLAQAAQQPGTYSVQWNGAAGSEGSWRFVVTALDDQGRTTTADRSFALNDTLGSLQVVPANGGLTATFGLAHPATVTVTLEKPNGIVVATLLSKALQAGPQTVSYTGRISGYRVRVVAANSIGEATLLSPVSASRS